MNTLQATIYAILAAIALEGFVGVNAQNCDCTAPRHQHHNRQKCRTED
jgi:hypothetical protein